MFKAYIDYIRDNPQHYWFKRKWYGWGWTPATWQGWLLTLGYVASLILFSLTIDDQSPPREVFFTFLLPILFLTILFIRIAYKKGETPKWQWGSPQDTKPPKQ